MPPVLVPGSVLAVPVVGSSGPVVAEVAPVVIPIVAPPEPSASVVGSSPLLSPSPDDHASPPVPVSAVVCGGLVSNDVPSPPPLQAPTRASEEMNTIAEDLMGTQTITG